jgi:hypothetical protein
MQLPPFVASRLKLQRARRHVDELEREITAFLVARPFRLVIEQQEEWHAWTVRLRKNVPLEFSAIIGDAVHNLRSALDLLACDLVRLNGNSTKGVYFPFSTDASGLKRQIRDKNLDRAGPDIVALVISLKPYRGGNLALRGIHDLDVQDKHQALIPVANVVDAPGGILMFGGRPNKIPNWQSLVTRDGQVIVMMPAVGNLSVGDEIAASFTLAFAETEPMAGREVVEALHELAELVAGILETFKTHCEGSDDKIAKLASIKTVMPGNGRALLIGSTKPGS